MPRRPLTRSEKWLFGTTLPLMGLILGSAALVNAINRPPDITIPAPPEVPNPNGYDYYAKAAASLTLSTPPVDPALDTATLPPAQAAERYSLVRRKAWLAANRNSLALFEKALRTPCVVPIKRMRSNPALLTLRKLARAKVAEANTCKMQGQWDRANTIGLDIIQMGGDISQGTLLDSLVGSAIRSRGAQVLEDVPGHLSGIQTLAAAKRLETLYPPREQMTRVLEQEKWESLTYTLDLLKKPDWRTRSGTVFGMSTGSALERLRMQTISKRRVVDELISIYDAAIAESKLPYSAPLPPRPEPSNLLVGALQPTAYTRFTIARDQTLLALLLHRYALRAYRMDHGRYPDNLQTLIPRYISHSYPDPFGNGTEPFHYRRQGDSYTLWSVGTDGKNDAAHSVSKVARPNQISTVLNQPGDVVVGP